MPPTTKTAVRQRLRELRRERVPARDRARDAAELELAALEVGYAAGLAPGDWVAAYEATRLEPPTDALVAAFVGRGIRVMVPVTLEDWDLDWREVAAAGEDPGELLGKSAIARASVAFVPAHGVDRSGTRIGQGKGCYDRALPRTDAVVVAVVHPWEVLDDQLPRDEYDRPVHAAIAAGSGVTRFA